MTNSSERWKYAGRYYNIVKFSDVLDRDGFGWELEDIAPAPGKGVVLEAFWDDSTGDFTVRVFTDQPLPLELVRRFLNEASRGVPPTG